MAHLKATTSGGQDDADRRAAEASCISNFFVNVFLTGTNKLHPYILSGDLNEDILRPETSDYVSGHPIQRLISPPTGLQLTSPTNPFTGAPTNDMTESIRASKLTVRFDYIMPCPLMYSNIVSSQIFRTDKLVPVPPNLNSNDDKIASDHLPVLMVFKNPYQNPFQLLSVTRSNLTVAFELGIGARPAIHCGEFAGPRELDRVRHEYNGHELQPDVEYKRARGGAILPRSKNAVAGWLTVFGMVGFSHMFQ